MMKILIMSDSHGNKGAMFRAVELDPPGLILHLGDHESDCGDLEACFPDIPLRSVRGNCDFMSDKPDKAEFTLGGKLFFMTHGHLHGVKRGLLSIKKSASGIGADILLFGHTHTPYCEIGKKLSIVNPGSISTGDKTYAVLEIIDGEVRCEIKRLILVSNRINLHHD